MLRKLLAVLTVTSIADAQNAAPPANLTAAQIVARMQSVNAATFSADFTQSYLAHAYNTSQTSTGHVVLSGLSADFSYTNPAGNRIVLNGTYTCSYLAAQRQMFMGHMSQAPWPMALIMSAGVAQSFTFTLASMGQPNAYVLVGTPNVPSQAFVKVIVYVDAQTFEVQRVLFLDAQQNRNRFDFTNIQRNVPLKPSQFVISAPPGTSFTTLPGVTPSGPLTCP